jgi:hypothetical protein
MCVRGHSGHQHVMCQQRCHAAAAGWLFIILSVYENPFEHTQIIMREAWGRKARAARDPSHRRCQISKASSEWEFYDRRRHTQMNTDCSDICVMCVTSSEFIQMHESPAGLIYEKGMLYVGNLILCSRESILLWASAFCGEICACWSLDLMLCAAWVGGLHEPRQSNGTDKFLQWKTCRMTGCED